MKMEFYHDNRNCKFYEKEPVYFGMVKRLRNRFKFYSSVQKDKRFNKYG